MVVCRVCGGDAAGRGRGGNALAGGDYSFAGGGVFCVFRGLCGSVCPEKQDSPFVSVSCCAHDRRCPAVREWGIN